MLYNYVTTTNDTSILTRALPLAEVCAHPSLFCHVRIMADQTYSLLSISTERALLVAQQPHDRSTKLIYEPNVRHGPIRGDELGAQTRVISYWCVRLSSSRHFEVCWRRLLLRHKPYTTSPSSSICLLAGVSGRSNQEFHADGH